MGQLVMETLEDHKERISRLEQEQVNQKISIIRQSFLGSLGAMAVLAIPILISWWIKKL